MRSDRPLTEWCQFFKSLFLFYSPSTNIISQSEETLHKNHVICPCSLSSCMFLDSLHLHITEDLMMKSIFSRMKKNQASRKHAPHSSASQDTCCLQNWLQQSQYQKYWSQGNPITIHSLNEFSNKHTKNQSYFSNQIYFWYSGRTTGCMNFCIGF